MRRRHGRGSHSRHPLLLKKGNERFVGGNSADRKLLAQVKQASKGQFPFAAIVTCPDSRVPPEMAFDQGIGGISVAHVAGNFVSQAMQAVFCEPPSDPADLDGRVSGVLRGLDGRHLVGHQQDDVRAAADARPHRRGPSQTLESGSFILA